MGLGLEISVLEIMSAGLIERLGPIQLEGLRAKYGPKDGPHPGLAMKAPRRICRHAHTGLPSITPHAPMWA